MDKHKCNIVHYLALVVYAMVLYAVVDFCLSLQDIDEVYTGNTGLSRSADKHCETLPTYPVLDIEDDEFSCAKAVRGEQQEKSFSQQPVHDLNVLLQQNCTEFTRTRQYLSKVRT